MALLGSCRGWVAESRRRAVHILPTVARRLESWKEIAVYFDRRVRTVQRWEKEEGLPVHRHAHRRRGTVYAWSHELDAWWESRGVSPAGDPPDQTLPRMPSPADVGGLHPPVSGHSQAGGESTAAAKSLPVAWHEWRPIARGVLAAGLAVLASVLIVWRLAQVRARNEAPAPGPVLEARYLLNRGSAAEVERAIKLCSAATGRAEAGRAANPAAEAAIHECLAHSALALTNLGRIPSSEGLRRAKTEAERALALEPRRADALAIATWAGFIQDWNAPAAEAGYRRAIALDPASALPHHGFAHLLSILGHHDEAIVELRRAQRAAPLSATLNDDGCWFFYRARRYQDAIVEAERALRLEPRRVGALLCAVDAHEAQGEHAAARDAGVAVLHALFDPAADTLAAAPPAEAARRLERHMLERLDERREHAWVPAMPFAMLYAQLGERDHALVWLERALAERDPVLLLVRVHPAFDSLRDDPRLEPLLRRAGV